VQARVFFGLSADGLWLPYLYNESACGVARITAMHNLHIHSKDVELFLSAGSSVHLLPLAHHKVKRHSIKTPKAQDLSQHTLPHTLPHLYLEHTQSAQETSHGGGMSGGRWMVMEEEEARYATQLWARQGQEDEWHSDEWLDDEGNGAVSRNLELSALDLTEEGSEGAGVHVGHARNQSSASMRSSVLFATCVSDGRALLLIHHLATGGGDASARHPLVWRLDIDDAVGQHAPRSRSVRYCRPCLVGAVGTSHYASHGASHGGVYLVWSQCVGTDAFSGGGGGVHGQTEREDCESFLSRRMSHLQWSAPHHIGHGSVAGQGTVSSDGTAIYVPLVEWVQVKWSNGMVNKATGVEWRKVYRLMTYHTHLDEHDIQHATYRHTHRATKTSPEDTEPIPKSRVGVTSRVVVVPGSTFGKGVKVLVEAEERPTSKRPQAGASTAGVTERRVDGEMMTMLVPAWYGVSVSQSPDAGSTWGPPSPFLPHGRHKESIEVSSKAVGGTTFQVPACSPLQSVCLPAPLRNWCACVHNPREVEHMSPRNECEFDLDSRVSITLIQLATASLIGLYSSPCTLEVCHVGCTWHLFCLTCTGALARCASTDTACGVHGGRSFRSLPAVLYACQRTWCKAQMLPYLAWSCW